MAAHWGPRWPAGWPRWAGFAQPTNGFLRRPWLGPDAARLLTDEELAAMSCRISALPAGAVPIVLNVNVLYRALTAAFQAAGAALAAIYLPCPGPRRPGASGCNQRGHRLRHQGGPRRRRAHARSVPWARRPGGPHLSSGPHRRPPRALRAHCDRAGPGLRRRPSGDGKHGTQARPAGRGRPVRVRSNRVCCCHPYDESCERQNFGGL